MNQETSEDFKKKANSFSDWFTSIVIANFVYLLSFQGQSTVASVLGAKSYLWNYSFWLTVFSLSGIFFFKALGVLAAYFRVRGKDHKWMEDFRSIIFVFAVVTGGLLGLVVSFLIIKESVILS